MLDCYRMSLPAFADARLLMDIAACLCCCWTASGYRCLPLLLLDCYRMSLPAFAAAILLPDVTAYATLQAYGFPNYTILQALGFLASAYSSGLADRNHCSDLQVLLIRISIFFQA
ncbi:hypothetical protein TNCT_78551 [Trichonephila clavata]|uniref:Uncharacterized protein n=1 Tax=Trichonephila clavata TaxID=2740835 RepID=A0A8X6LNT1_TRICU|nr:hypothetical protein TNCT_78551 [Trichonephila clavata]